MLRNFNSCGLYNGCFFVKSEDEQAWIQLVLIAIAMYACFLKLAGYIYVAPTLIISNIIAKRIYSQLVRLCIASYMYSYIVYSYIYSDTVYHYYSDTVCVQLHACIETLYMCSYMYSDTSTVQLQVQRYCIASYMHSDAVQLHVQ